ncbi:unnamed protein product [Rhizopus stolonifer]
MLYYDNHSNAQDAQKPFIHPYDPIVEEEYETLIKSWKQQLIDTTPKTPNKEYVKLAWMRLIDHYLDQQWLDSKQMLQCAQAWSARDSLSLTEAVHTMNILSLKSMQRSLDARQELLQALGDPEMMVSFGLYDDVKQERFSLAGSENEDEVHAPLLVRHTYDSTSSSSYEENVIAQLECGLDTERYHEDAESIDETEAILDAYRYQNQDEYLAQSTRHLSLVDHQQDTDEEEDNDDVFRERNPRLHSSMSSPNGLYSLSDESKNQNLRRSTSWREIRPGDEAPSTHSCDSQLGAPWKRWFGDNQRSSQSSIVFANQEFANEKIEANNAFFIQDHPLKEAEKTKKPRMLRSESNVSAFRPISNNLAPRCQPKQARTSTYSFLQQKEHHDSIKMMKSRSFPSKSALISTFKKSSSPPPIPHKERRGHSKIRSIVRKKVSFSKIFGGRKGSASTTFTT